MRRPRFDPRPRVLRLVRGEQPSPYPKASLFLRVLARIIDIAIAWGLFVCGHPFGPVLALLFLLLADGLFQGQSPGKKICGIKVVHVPTRCPARFRESVLRNAPLGLVVILGMLPPPLGRLAFVFGVVGVVAIETWKVFRDHLGLRLGDEWAQTQVVDGKVTTGEKRAPARARTAAAADRMGAARRRASRAWRAF